MSHTMYFDYATVR